MANVKITQDKNGVRWLELMRNGSGTLLEIRDDEEVLQIINALQQSVHLTVLPVREIETVCPHCSLVFDVPVPEPHARKNPCVKSVT